MFCCLYPKRRNAYNEALEIQVRDLKDDVVKLNSENKELVDFTDKMTGRYARTLQTNARLSQVVAEQAADIKRLKALLDQSART
jgi:hypothetical protein